jgi:hypothetical protein
MGGLGVEGWTSSLRRSTRRRPARGLRLRRGAGTNTSAGAGQRLPGRLLCCASLTLVLVASPGCSLVYTRGPHPEIHPPPECTTSLAAPAADTALAVLSLTLLGLGVASAAVRCPECGGLDVVGLGAVVLGTGFGALFTTSAAVGYGRTGACRSLKESNRPPPPAPPPASSTLLRALPSAACGPLGDAPRVCPTRVPE